MKKRMFSKFSNYLHQAVEALTPQLTLQEEFMYHWKSVTEFFMDSKGDRINVEQTSLSSHLDQMIVLLQEEESSIERGGTGPCMEYLLQHKLLETLYSLGRTDHPPGMKQLVLSFFTKLLSRLKQPLLPNISVHRAVHRLIKSCGEVKAGPSETEEIQFLCTVCAIVKTDPYLVNFFIEVSKEKPSPDSTDPVPKSDFSLVQSLLALSNSADSRVAVKSCEGLMLCASLPEQNAAVSMVNDTEFCTQVSQRLIESYLKLPSNVHPSELDMVEAKWGLDVITESEDQQSFLGKRHLISFLSWLDYCDQLIGVANPYVAKSLSKSIRETFLDVIMEPSLLQTSETGAVLATAYLTRCLRTVCSHPLLAEFCKFILGDDMLPEVEGTDKWRVRRRLIDRCDHLSEELSLASLKLFDMLLQKDNEFIIYNLVLRNLIGRDYYTEDTVMVKVEDSRTKEESQSSDSTSEKSSPLSSTSSSPVPSTSRNRIEVHKIVNSYFSLLPEDLKSSYQTADSGYDMYLKDAHKQYSDMCEMCHPWSWPKEPVTSEVYHMTTFYEGSFLRMILDKLSRLLDQSYTINLQLTSVIAKLASIPHPNLQEFFMDPYLCLKDNAKSLFNVLQKVANEIKTQLGNDPELGKKLVIARKSLLGVMPTITSLRQNVHENRLEGQSRLEAIIVFEEFCKEMAAIVFVQHHAVMSRS
ncbi:FHF complex subunit HOOK interacting protein 2A-like isoform X1 [Mytilus galloprovincialis]|uniref:FHF complex subunit HOOK interacting protein 2A-like isoform X1 n=1 Tax=Mytilus galloprovincialis TaxID=29158 RepID=UPI003F7C94BE